MKRVSMSKWRQRITSGVLLMAMALTLAGSVVIPATAEEVKNTPSGQVVYEPDNGEFDKWKKQDTKVAPVKEGYLFGGWYKDAAGDEALKSEEVANHTDPVYAKFVPAYVLSVKAQWNYAANKEAEQSSLRILVGVDSLKYQSVGVQVSLGNTNTLQAKTTARVYDTVCTGSGNDVKKVKASETFGSAAKYYGVWKVRVSKGNYEGQIYVRPYWVTQDGTTVYGMAKYFHTSDQWKNYITVPINKMPAQGDTSSAEAAGMVTVKYEPSEVTFKKVEDGRIFGVGEAAFDVVDDGNGTVTIIGNRKSVDPDNAKKDESVFANLVFEKKVDIFELSGDKYIRSKFLEFTISDAKFCDWDENLTGKTVDNSLGVWNITY